MATNSSSATTGLIFFLVLTLIYFIVRYNLEMGQSETIYTIIYYLGVVVSQYFINLTAISSRCGNTNYYLAFMVTIVPWVFIFGLLNIMLAQFPGWKAPFSNTFGYLIANAAGARDLLIDHILKDDFTSRLTPGKKAVANTQVGKNVELKGFGELRRNDNSYTTDLLPIPITRSISDPLKFPNLRRNFDDPSVERGGTIDGEISELLPNCYDDQREVIEQDTTKFNKTTHMTNFYYKKASKSDENLDTHI